MYATILNLIIFHFDEDNQFFLFKNFLSYDHMENISKEINLIQQRQSFKTSRIHEMQFFFVIFVFPSCISELG